LALATILQAYTGVSDDEVIEATVMDRRWQLALDCLDCDTAPFSKGTLVGFRARLIAQNWDRRLIERTVEIAAQHQVFGARQLRAALDSSPLWGAGRVEDTYNLLGHALRKALSVIARQQGRGLAAVAEEAGAALLGGSSLKAALDLNWDEPVACAQALTIILTTLETVEAYAAGQPLGQAAAAQVASSLAVAEQVRAQDVTADAAGQPVLRQGVAKDRRISVEDGAMRHGRKSQSRLIDGYKRHVLHDLDSALVRAVGLTPAHAPEASVTDAILADLAEQRVVLGELPIDRAYLSSTLVRSTQKPVRPAALRRGPELTRHQSRRPSTSDGRDYLTGALGKHTREYLSESYPDGIDSYRQRPQLGVNYPLSNTRIVDHPPSAVVSGCDRNVAKRKNAQNLMACFAVVRGTNRGQWR